MENIGNDAPPAREPLVDQQEIDRVLRIKRIPQAKSCRPCRQRKVRCDQGQPCTTCERRGHPQICLYDVGSAEKRRGTRPAAVANGHITKRSPHAALSTIPSSAASSDGPPGTRLSPALSGRSNHVQHVAGTAEDSFARSNSDASTADPSGSARNSGAPEQRYEGGSSVLTIVGNSLQHSFRELQSDVGAALGLENTLDSYPFMEAETAKARWANLVKIVPNRQEVLR